MTIITAIFMSFFAGYAISDETGVEPGYFQAVETGGYGTKKGATIKGLSAEDQEYYRKLAEESEDSAQ